MNPTLHTLLSHKTVRDFLPFDMPYSEVALIADAARRASSWMNGQHYTIIRITSPQLRQRIAQASPHNPQIAACSEFWIFVADVHKADVGGRAYSGSFAASGSVETLITATTDTALAAQNAAVAAESLGYAVCFVGSIRTLAADLIEWLALPKHTFPLFGLCMGKPAVEMRLKPRLPECVSVVENRYPDDGVLSEALAQYEKVMTEFAEEREKLPYREKFARFYDNEYAPQNREVLQRQGLCTQTDGVQAA